MIALGGVGDEFTIAKPRLTRNQRQMENHFELTFEHLKAWFGQFNRDYFGGKLPLPRLGITHSRTRLGSMGFKKRTHLGKTITYGHSINMSVLYEQDEWGYKNVFLHEMIHYYIAYNNIHDTGPHGEVFRRIMNGLNSQYGWEMKVSESTRDLKRAQDEGNGAYFLVLALHLTSGKKMLSVVMPRYWSVINKQLGSVKEVESYSWHITNDPYFNGYRQVRTLRGVYVNPDFFNEMVEKMPPFEKT